MSSVEAFDNLSSCVDKGCLHYVTDQMHPDTRLPEFFCLRGTSKNEAYRRL